MKTLIASCLVLLATAAFAGESAAPVSPHSGMMTRKVDIGDVHVAKAVGPNAHTVAEVVTQRAALADKPVLVRGKVVKFNPQIMGKNWVHLRDGSGSEAEETHDILVTTMAMVKVGDVVTAQGTVHTDKDFGAGYFYRVLIEDATVKP